MISSTRSLLRLGRFLLTVIFYKGAMSGELRPSKAKIDAEITRRLLERGGDFARQDFQLRGVIGDRPEMDALGTCLK
jgi:hypothetical protein